MNLGITGPAYTIGAACAAGNMGLIHAAQMLRLGEVDFALGGGVSESPQTFGIFAGFKSQNALAAHADPTKASRPFDKARNGIVISEGGCIYTLERLDDAQARGAKIYGEIAGYCVNSDATDAVLRDLRTEVDGMLAAGQIAAAEARMEDVRQQLVAKGVRIRRINQAYFAWYGTYTARPDSIDPLGAQVREIRQRTGSLHAFLDAVAGFTSRGDVQHALDTLRARGR